MKILSLDLIAYGPFSGTSLVFPGDRANLHIIYGPNEAGKSCALRALSNALYGIPSITGDGFLHPYDDLRIGLTLDSNSGPMRVIRRKGRAQSLRRNDAAESLFPAAEWAALLPAAERELFDQMFAVDHAEIAKGGKLLLSSSSDLGGLLFAATGGLERLREVQAELQNSAEELFAKRAKNPSINKAVSEYKQAMTAINQSQLAVAGYKKLRDSVEEAEEESRRLEKAIGAASVEEQRLRRLQQALPFAARRRDRIEQLRQHSESRTLPDDFEDRYRRGVSAVREANSEIGSQTRDIEGLQANIDTTPVVLALLERESEIDRLYQASAAVKKGAEDRLRREQSAEAARAEATALLQAIGVRMELEKASELRIPDPAKTRIFALSTSKMAMDQEAAASARELQSATEAQAKAREELAGLAAAVDTGALEEALARAPSGRDLEAENSALAQAVADSRGEIERSLAALPGWDGPADELGAAPVPLPETVADFQTRFLEQTSEERRLQADHARLRGEMEQAEKDLRRIEQEQEVPTEGHLTASRSGRDAEWVAIRADWLSGIASDGMARASAFETAVVTSDQIADRLRREAARVSEKAGLLASIQRLGEKLTQLEAQIQAARGAGGSLQSRWESCWGPAGIKPRTPVEMQSWLRQRETILAKRGELQKTERELESLETLMHSIRRVLVAQLVSEVSLRELAAQARRVVSEQSELRQRRATLQAEAERSVRTIAALEARVSAANQALADWSAAWREATEKLPIRRDASPGEVQVVVERLGSLIAKLDEAAALEDRIAKLKRDEADFQARVASLAAPVENPFEAIARLNAELQRNRTNRDLLKTFVAQIEEKQKLLARSQEALRAGNALLAELCREAGVGELDGVGPCIENAREKRRLSTELAELEDSLSSFTGGETIPHLLAELEAVSVDELPNRIAQLQEDVVKLRDQKANRDQLLGALRLELKQKEEAGSAGHAAEDAELLRSRIVNLTAEYVRLRLASRILTNAVERYRDRNQGPLLQSAARLFEQMTDGSFANLRVDWNERGEAELVGVRAAGGKQVSVEGMSEGTRDQLFLALRLAYVLNYCEAHGTVPFIADDVLITFDDGRAKAALRALETVSKQAQVLVFTHHQHLLELAKDALPPAGYCVHRLG